MVNKHILRIAVVVLIVMGMHVQPATSAPAASSGYVTFLPGFTPEPSYSSSLCEMTVPDRIEGLRVIYNGGNPYFANLRDVIAVPGYGKVLGNAGYQDSGPGGNLSWWGFTINTSYKVAPNTPITVYTIAYTDDTYKTAFYSTQLVFDCTTAAVLSISSGPIGDGKVCTFMDGRLNKCDLQQTAAVYCQVDSSIDVYAVDHSTGYLAFNVTSQELETVPANPTENTFIKQGNGVRLYRLTSGKLQVNRVDANGTDHAFIFDDCP